MKRILLLLCVAVLSLGLVACSNNSQTTTEVTNEQSSTTAGLYDCFEFDIENETFTNNILISFNIPDGYVSTPQKELLYKAPKYYIGDFINESESKTISVYQYTDKIDENDCIKLDDEWSILTNSTDEYLCSFCNTALSDKYTLIVNIVNNDKTKLEMSDALALFNKLIDKNLELDSEIEIENKTYEVSASVDTPAKLGEFVSTYVRNTKTDKYEPILIAINEVTTDGAEQLVEDYDDEVHYIAEEKKRSRFEEDYKSNFKESVPLMTGCEYVVVHYSIYFPNDYKSGEDFELPIALCNYNDSSSTINGVMNLTGTIRDVLIYKENIKPGSIWNEGVLVYQIPINFSNYLVKLAPQNDYEAKYINVAE